MNASSVAPEGCAGCTDEFYGSNSWYTAAWSLDGDCAPGGQCAECVPSCTAGGVLQGTFDEAGTYYHNNRCDSWRCPETMPERVEYLSTASAQEVEQAIAESKGRIRYNEMRRAIQIYDCNGVVAVHLPLSAIVSRQLSARQSPD
jgi:hypothetical protein